MSCKTFLRSFAYQYCKHKYIKKNCCASHKVYCLKTGRGRTPRRGRTLIFRSTNSNATTSSNSTSSLNDKVFKRNAKYNTPKIRTHERLRQSRGNKTITNPFVSKKNSTSTLIKRRQRGGKSWGKQKIHKEKENWGWNLWNKLGRGNEYRRG